MNVTLFQHVKATAGDQGFVDDCQAQAVAMVDQYLTDNARPGVTIPAVIKERAVLEVGSDLFHRRQARNGIAGLDGGMDGGAPVRIARDPMRAAYEMLAPYIGFGIG